MSKLFIAIFLCNLLIPLVMILAGFLLYKHPPKDINGLIGYRTNWSRKSQETWDFAQVYCGKLWIRIGIILLIVSAIVQIPFAGASEDTIGMMTFVVEMAQLVVMVAAIYPVERALRKKFDKDGKRYL